MSPDDGAVLTGVSAGMNCWLEAVCAREGASAYRVEPGTGTPLPTRLLG